MDTKRNIKPIIVKDAEYIRELIDTTTSASEMSDANDSSDENEEDVVEVDFVIEGNADDVNVPKSNESRSGDVVFGKDHRTRWELTSKCKRNDSFMNEYVSGVMGDAKHATKAVDCWRAFFTDDMMNIIVASTNKEIKSKGRDFAGECKSTDLAEMKAFFGLLYLTGYFKGSRLNTEDLWNSDGTGIELFTLTMSRERFHFLMRNLRFDDKVTRSMRRSVDKLASIRTVFDLFTTACRKNFSINHYATIGEILVKFNGRCGFRQYVPGEPGKSGIKIFALVDTQTFYASNLEVYVGKQPEGPFPQDCSSYGVVKRLCEPIIGSGRNVTGDSWFSSFKLAKDLLEERVTYVGALSKKDKEIPTSFINTKNRQPNTSKYAFHDDCVTLVSYVPERGKTILLLSTLPNDFRTSDDGGKPEIVSFYNETKNGVDGVSKLCSNYSVARNTNRWSMAVFYFLLNIGAVNAHVLYKENVGPLKRRVFIKNLSLELVSEYLNRQRGNVPRELGMKRQKVLGDVNECETGTKRNRTAEDGGRQKGCLHCCSRKSVMSNYTCDGCGNHVCSEHVQYMCKGCAEVNNYNGEIN